MLLMFNALGSMFNELRAQDENAAFYIYRNDGDFDGFFFDEVVRMGYSKSYYVRGELSKKSIGNTSAVRRLTLFQQNEKKYESNGLNTILCQNVRRLEKSCIFAADFVTGS